MGSYRQPEPSAQARLAALELSFAWLFDRVGEVLSPDRLREDFAQHIETVSAQMVASAADRAPSGMLAVTEVVVALRRLGEDVSAS